MKVLVAGVILDSTGWARASQDYVLALDAAGIDVVCRPIKLNDRREKPPLRIQQLMEKPATGCDVVIQHILPPMFDYNGRMRNIGLFASETSHFRDSGWADHLNTMDEVWVINQQQVEACKASGVTRPIRVAPHATDITRFQRSYQALEVLRPYKEAGEFLFYFVGEMVRRKNLPALLRAFHTEFDQSEPVRLVIKSDLPGFGPQEAKQKLAAFCEDIRKGLKLGRHKEEILITERLTEEGILRLHSSCDCFVMPSHGEAWSLPAFDAMAMGKTPICTGWGGFTEYLSNEEGWLIDYRMEPVFGAVDSLDNLYTGNEAWASVDIFSLRRAMREAYENEGLRKEKAVKGIERSYDFSYESVGNLLKGYLNDERSGELARTPGQGRRRISQRAAEGSHSQSS